MTGQAGRLAWRAAVAVTFGLAGQLASLGLLATSAWLITTSSLRPPILTLTVAIAAVRLFALLRGLGRYGERLASHDLALRLLARVRVRAYRHLERLVPGGLGEISGGDVVSRVVADVEATEDLIVRVAVPVMTGSLTAAVAVALSALLLPAAGLALGAGLMLAGAVIPLASRRLGGRAAESLAAGRGHVAAVVVEALQGAPDLLACGAVEDALGSLGRAEYALGRALRRTAAAAGAGDGLAALARGATTLGVVALGTAVMARHAGPGHLSAVAVAVLGFVALAAFDAIATLPDAFARLGDSLGAYRRVRSLGTLPSPVAEPESPRPMPGDPTMVLSDVSVAHTPDGPPVLEHVDLILPPGRRVAVVGPSGAGKTTLALTLLRFIERRHGQMTLGGVEVRELPADEVRARIAWAPQDPSIFAATLAANLRLARPEADDAELADVLASLGLGGWLERLPEGLSTELGERGQRVSGGERQRVGLARALLARRPILLLDEPTAHLDEENEILVRRAVLRHGTGRALVWITHRLTGLDDFDEVIVLARGQIVERGHPSELAGAGGPYADLLTAAGTAGAA